MAKARILNIERCSTQDGPGIRTTVFLKGCHLKCRWCCNPESQSFDKEILLKSVICTGCRRCQELCSSNAIKCMEDYGMITDQTKCSACLKCVDGCLAGARTLQGKDMSSEELIETLMRDEIYYKTSGGGITFSGGEPCIYADFIAECAKGIHKKGYTVLVETCGYIDRKRLAQTAESADIIYCDYKHFDPVIHEKVTGTTNELILSNIKWLDDNFKGHLELRYPYIPGINSDEECIERFLEFADSIQSVSDVVFLPYHRLGLDKYRGLGREYPMGQMPSLKLSDIEYLKKYERKYNLNISVY